MIVHTRNWPQGRCNHGGWGSLGRLGGYQLTKATPIRTGRASLCCAHTCTLRLLRTRYLACPVRTTKAPVCAFVPALMHQLAARRPVARRRVYFHPPSTLNFLLGTAITPANLRLFLLTMKLLHLKRCHREVYSTTCVWSRGRVSRGCLSKSGRRFRARSTNCLNPFYMTSPHRQQQTHVL